MGETLAQNRFAVPEPFLGPDHFGLKVREVGNTKVFEFAHLEQIPHTFLRIQLGAEPGSRSKWMRFQTLGFSSETNR